MPDVISQLWTSSINTCRIGINSYINSDTQFRHKLVQFSFGNVYSVYKDLFYFWAT